MVIKKPKWRVLAFPKEESQEKGFPKEGTRGAFPKEGSQEKGFPKGRVSRGGLSQRKGLKRRAFPKEGSQEKGFPKGRNSRGAFPKEEFQEKGSPLPLTVRSQQRRNLNTNTLSKKV
ncbi:UNVERIFIED_CONTAM: hypothetical protein RMT77_014631 [Armadillidium vulgare]